MPSELRRSAQRHVTQGDGVRTLHSFSYGAHYDLDNVAFGPLVALNEEQVEPGRGYDVHRHADVEIVTWVLEGELAHQDTTGHGGTIPPGVAQRLSAGAGADHAERNASDEHPLRFVQMMLRPRGDDAAAEYASVEVRGEGLLPTVATRADAELWVARPGSGEVVVEAAPKILVHVTRGTVVVGTDVLGPGDELRLSEPADVRMAGGGEALVWRLEIA